MCNLNHAIGLYKEEVDKKVKELEDRFEVTKQVKVSEKELFIKEYGEDIKGCAVCNRLLNPTEFRWHNRNKKELQWACKSCHNRIDNFNMDKNKCGQKIDRWLGKFATEEDKAKYNEYISNGEK